MFMSHIRWYIFNLSENSDSVREGFYLFARELLLHAGLERDELLLHPDTLYM